MNYLTSRFLWLTSIMVFFAAASPAYAAPKAACEVLPAAQAQRILGFPVKASGSKITGNVPGTTGTQCDYIGNHGGAPARLSVVTAASPAAAALAMQKMSAVGLPAWAMAQKGASFLIAGAGDPPNRKMIKQMLAVGLKSL